MTIPFNNKYHFNVQHQVVEKSDRPSTHNSSKKTNPKKRKPELQDITRDVPAKRMKTEGSKKVGKQVTKGLVDDYSEAVGGSKLAKSSKKSKSSSKSSEPLQSSKLEGKKRKHVDEQEMAAESSPRTKRIKIDSMPATPK